jgi:hypothetical protein
MTQRMMFQAIETKWLGPTNVRGSRVKATAEAGSITLSWDHSLNTDENHRKAAEALAAKFDWVGGYYGELAGGALPGRGYAFVFVGKDAS